MALGVVVRSLIHERRRRQNLQTDLQAVPTSLDKAEAQVRQVEAARREAVDEASRLAAGSGHRLTSPSGSPAAPHGQRLAERDWAGGDRGARWSDRGRQVALAVAVARRLAAPGPGRDRQRGLDAGLPRHGHRHGQAHRRRAAGRPAPPDRHPGRAARPRRSPTSSSGPGRRSPTAGRAGSARSWWVARPSTSGRSWTTSSSQAPTRTSGRGWRPTWPRSARSDCTSGWPG